MAAHKTNPYAMRDPRDQYPSPPFPKQPQPKPGLAREMDPKPDHGEDSYVGHGRLEGRKALITGGDSGIGRAVAIAYAREGAEVAINYLEDEKEDAQSLLELLKSEDRKLHLLPGDLTDKAFCRSLVRDAREKMGGLDILVVNAGYQNWQGDFQAITDEQLDVTMKTNVYAMFYMCQEALKDMPPGGSIINVTSVQGFDPSPTLIDYATTKWAIRGFTEALAKAAMNQGVRVNAVAPGPFWTPLQSSGGQSVENVQNFGKGMVPMDRPGQPAEIASAFVYLASQEASYTSGAILKVSGGDPA